MRKAEKLTQAIDEHYKAGVGEEYLSRLVSASEESASQTRILKDALVEDMRSLLTELIDRQIAANTSSHSQLGQQIAQSFGQELKEPLDKIAHAVGKVSQDQGSAVQSLLTDVLASFSTRMEGMFGNQLSGIHDMQQQTTAALQNAVAQLEKLSGTVEGAGKKASEDMAAQVAEAVRKLESRQAVMNEEMRKFVGDIRDLGEGLPERHVDASQYDSVRAVGDGGRPGRGPLGKEPAARGPDGRARRSGDRFNCRGHSEDRRRHHPARVRDHVVHWPDEQQRRDAGDRGG